MQAGSGATALCAGAALREYARYLPSLHPPGLPAMCSCVHTLCVVETSRQCQSPQKEWNGPDGLGSPVLLPSELRWHCVY